MAISAELVKKLRDMTGAGFMECKAALTEANGDLDAAITLLRKRGLASAAKKAGRTTSQGSIGSYIHMGGKIGVLVEVNCESDFVARTDQFVALVKEIAMHIAAADPKYVRRDEVPADVLDKEKEIYRAQLAQSGKKPEILEKIIEGKLDSYLRAGRAGRSEVDPRPGGKGLAAHRRSDRQDGREHRRLTIRPIQDRRSGRLERR